MVGSDISLAASTVISMNALFKYHPENAQEIAFSS
jgi:hypothetical protein